MYIYKIYFGNGTTVSIKAPNRGEAVKIAQAIYGWIVADVSFVR
jgi:hypothetical protein